MPFTYNEKTVLVPGRAEVSAAFKSGELRDVVQQAINRVEPWEEGEDPIEEFDLPYEIGSRVVVLYGTEKPLWGVNPHHKARRPGPSPFVSIERSDPRNVTDFATLELSGTVDAPVLTRVYPGAYMPPLPWMMSAPNADGGEEACIEYWNNHAFVLRPQTVPSELSAIGPRWYWRAS